MAEEIHINYLDTEEDDLYCRRFKDVEKFKNISHLCKDCPYFSGFAQGQGVECTWDDPREESPLGIRGVDDPIQELKELTIAEAEQAGKGEDKKKK